ncbi:MAG TPA: DNA starvation/stationary phase protection protein [Cytophagales bacterium]|nr:DNA starvation/stationary phase protection protein [Cytophagales bacterium]HAA22863.1 DNA starvation/stationary phase protection protein [Cytophagales bacterium]HAP65344.1 DNA starvation/stationary phase protection protein [Cytophagales bacterium]
MGNHELNQIGLGQQSSKEVSDKLNVLLANYKVFYMNARGFHWNIRGEKFFELHSKFEELYNDLQEKIDELAERILTLGFTPMHRYSDFLAVSAVEEAQDVSNGREAVKRVLEAYAVLLPLERELLSLSGANDDEGTSSLMSDYISQQEKLVWMYSAYLDQR